MNFSPMFVLLILAIFLKHSNTTSDTVAKIEERVDLALNIGGVLIKVPSDIAKLLIWKSVKLPSDISDKVGVRHVVSTLKFSTPNIVKRQLIRLRKKIPVAEWKFELGDYVYTIASGSFGIKAYKSKKVLPPHISKAKLACARRKEKLRKMYSYSKSKLKNTFKKIPKGLKDYFRRLTKR